MQSDPCEHRSASHLRPFVRGAGASAACLFALWASPVAEAAEFTLQIEPAAAFWADKPDSGKFRAGFYGAIRPGVSLGPIVSAQWSYAFMYVPNGETVAPNGQAHFVTAGLRFHPLGWMGDQSSNLDGLWVDGNVGYARAGTRDRFGFDSGIGYNFQATPWFALGPVVRYGHIVQPNGVPNVDPRDSQYITAGLNMAFGSPPKPPVECADCDPVTTVYEKPVAPMGCADGDFDGTCDTNDRCPTASGPGDTLGCPIDPCGGAPLVVLVQFPFDSAELPRRVAGNEQTMDPVLDAVADAIAQDRSCRVCIVGHASEEGAVDYNLELSERRAESVSDYLTARGLADRKMPSMGMGAACQLDPERSLAANRRVEFVRLDEGASCPTTCTQ